MNNKIRKTAAGLAVLIMALSAFTGCSDRNDSDTPVIKNTTNTYDVSEDSDVSAERSKAESASNKNTSAAVINTSNIFSERDLSQTADTASAKKITV